jgi:hypothetical protein
MRLNSWTRITCGHETNFTRSTMASFHLMAVMTFRTIK